MGAILLSPLYLLLNFYLIMRILKWFSTLNSFLGSKWFVIPFLVLYILTALTPLSAAFAHGRLKAATKRICNYWFGILMYFLMFLMLADLGRILYYLMHHQSIFTPFGTEVYRIVGGAVFLGTILLSCYGIIHAAQIKKTHYDVVIQKECPIPSLTIALAADLHLGYSVGSRQLRKIKKIMDVIEPDLVIWAGDMFDNDFDAISDPDKAAAILGSIKSTYGSFACWGNHDLDEVILAGFTFRSEGSTASDPRMDEFLKKSGIRILEDETLLISNAFYLNGRLDASCKEKSGVTRLRPQEIISRLDHAKPVLVIDHQPSELHELADAGADLVLSGHTHDGQLFPGNLANRIGWTNSCGKYCEKAMTSIVTSGAGIWGPAMRIGTDSEVVEITVTFQGPDAAGRPAP